MKKVLFPRKDGRGIFQIIILLLVLPSFLRTQNTEGCSGLIKSNKCSCYTFEDGKKIFCEFATNRVRINYIDTSGLKGRIAQNANFTAEPKN